MNFRIAYDGSISKGWIMVNRREALLQQYLIDGVNGKSIIDLGHCDIPSRHLHDLDLSENFDLRYSPDRGMLVLRECIANHYNQDIKNVIVTHGVQEALYLFYRSYLNHNDHVITFVPSIHLPCEALQHMNVSVTRVALSDHEQYYINTENIKRAIQTNTKLIILSNPHNPTGHALSKDEWEQIITICQTYHIFLLCDESYLVDYTQSVLHRLKECAIVNSISQTYGFPGLRIGWLVTRSNIIKKAIDYKRCSTLANSSLSESLALQILRKSNEYFEQYKNLVSRGYDILADWLKTYDCFKLIEPCGTPFIYLKLPNKLNSVDFCRTLLDKKRVLVVPGEFFHDQHAMRVSISQAPEFVKSGLEKIAQHYQQIMAAA